MGLPILLMLNKSGNRKHIQEYWVYIPNNIHREIFTKGPSEERNEELLQQNRLSIITGLLIMIDLKETKKSKEQRHLVISYASV